MSSFNIVRSRKIYFTTMKNLPVSYRSVSSDILKLDSYEGFRDIPDADSLNPDWADAFRRMAKLQLDCTFRCVGGIYTKISNYDSIEFDQASMFILYDLDSKDLPWHLITFDIQKTRPLFGEYRTKL